MRRPDSLAIQAVPLQSLIVVNTMRAASKPTFWDGVAAVVSKVNLSAGVAPTKSVLGGAATADATAMAKFGLVIVPSVVKFAMAQFMSSPFLALEVLVVEPRVSVRLISSGEISACKATGPTSGDCVLSLAYLSLIFACPLKEKWNDVFGLFIASISLLAPSLNRLASVMFGLEVL